MQCLAQIIGEGFIVLFAHDFMFLAIFNRVKDIVFENLNVVNRFYFEEKRCFIM